MIKTRVIDLDPKENVNVTHPRGEIFVLLTEDTVIHCIRCNCSLYSSSLYLS